jgi:flagellar biosynthesis protein FlhF
MLVGGPGVGKTVTTAKLAARARLSGHAVKVITTDTLRSGAVEQLAKLLELMGLETATADSPEALSVWLAAHSETKKPAALFIDTPGTNALSKGERDDLLGFIKAGSIEPVLVHAAGADSTDAADDAKLFAALGVRRMIVTRLDAARRLGSLLAAADAARLSIAEVSLSPYLSEPLNALTPGALARVLITQTGSTLALRRSDSRTIEEKRSQ